MRRVLLTSFEPFGGHAINSSLEVGRALAQRPPAGVHLECLVLPVVAGVCVEHAWECIEKVNPALVLALGQSARATTLRIEKQALNLNDFSITDNAGNQPHQERIVPHGPTSYQSTIAGVALHANLVAQNIPAQVSRSAGTYVCNHLFYGLLHRAAETGATHQTGFIHLPLLPGQVKRRRSQAAMSLECMVRGIRLAIATCLDTRPPGRA